MTEALQRTWTLGVGPGSDQLLIDLDSTICEVCGTAKGGVGYGSTKRLGYHPLLAARAQTGAVLHVHMRKGEANTSAGPSASSWSSWPGCVGPGPPASSW